MVEMLHKQEAFVYRSENKHKCQEDKTRWSGNSGEVYYGVTKYYESSKENML